MQQHLKLLGQRHVLAGLKLDETCTTPQTMIPMRVCAVLPLSLQQDLWHVHAINAHGSL